MSDMPAKGSPEGIRWTTAVATGATTSFDLTSYARRWVKITADQNCYFAFSTTAHGGANGDLVLSGDVAAGDKVAGSTTLFKVVADDLDAGALGVQRVVDLKYPFLLMRAKTAATTLVKIKPTSDSDSSQ
jgi:hypothetical protein